MKNKQQVLSIVCFFCFLTLGAQTNYNIKQVLQMVKKNNPILKTESYNQEIIATDIITAKLRPNLSLNNQTLVLGKPELYLDQTSWYNSPNRQVWWQLTKKIQLPTLRTNKIQLALLNHQLSQDNYFETQRNVFIQVGNKWLDGWYMQKKLEILSQAKNNVDSLLTINKLRYNKQVITQSDLLRTQLLVDFYDLQIKNNQENYTNQLTNLKFLLGTNQNITIDGNSQFIEENLIDYKELINIAQQSRADVQVAKKAIDLTATNLSLQDALRLPQPEFGIIYNPQNKVPYYGIYTTIELPFFSRNQGEIKKAIIQKDQAQQHLQTIEKQINAEIEVSYNSYLVQQRNLKNFAEILTRSKQILQSVKYAYLKGGTTIVDFLEAQRSWLETQQQYNDLCYQYRLAYLQLLYTTGLIHQLAN